MMYHCMTVFDMVYHVQNSYLGIPNYTITDTIKIMIEKNIISVSVTKQCRLLFSFQKSKSNTENLDISNTDELFCNI